MDSVKIFVVQFHLSKPLKHLTHYCPLTNGIRKERVSSVILKTNKVFLLSFTVRNMWYSEQDKINSKDYLVLDWSSSYLKEGTLANTVPSLQVAKFDQKYTEIRTKTSKVKFYRTSVSCHCETLVCKSNFGIVLSPDY